MREFAGLESADKGTRAAMMDFALHLSVGNMDEAFKAIKMIKRWEKMQFFSKKIMMRDFF